MVTRINPEITLRKEHTARQVQRASTYLINLVAAGLLLGGAIVAQVVLDQFVWWITTAGIILALVPLLCLRIALQWDRAVVLRVGRFHALKGPGIFWLLPIVEQVARYVDMRIRAT